MMKNSVKLGFTADDIQEKENIVNSLNDQRDELVENYIKGQRLALSLWRNSIKDSKRRAFVRWYRNTMMANSEFLKQKLRKNVDLISGLKDRLRQLELDNDQIANENEELRQFSLDGYEIAKSVQNLT